MLTTNQKGAIAEAAIMKAAFEVGYDVYRPAIEGGRYDLILVTGDALVRVQCKWAPLARGVVTIRVYSARRTRDGLTSVPICRASSTRSALTAQTWPGAT